VRKRVRRGLEHLLAVGYGLTYEDLVASLPAYQALLDEIVEYARRSVPSRTDPRAVQVLDVASGIGTLAFRLAREGFNVVGLESVEYLVEIAREKRRMRNVPNVAFHQVAVGLDPWPSQQTFDFVVGLHTLYWHPRPQQLLDAARRALKPDGYALFVNFTRPVHVTSTFRAVRAREGLRPALRALRWLVATAIFERLREYEPHYTDAEELRTLLTTAGFDVLDAKAVFLADLSVLCWLRRGR
jgi:2-polyprenyl-3-methyl-5-hydroxy-6-metoxy-1,4-benzoquinol methylase